MITIRKSLNKTTDRIRPTCRRNNKGAGNIRAAITTAAGNKIRGNRTAVTSENRGKISRIINTTMKGKDINSKALLTTISLLHEKLPRS